MELWNIKFIAQLVKNGISIIQIPSLCMTRRRVEGGGTHVAKRSRLTAAAGPNPCHPPPSLSHPTLPVHVPELSVLMPDLSLHGSNSRGVDACCQRIRKRANAPPFVTRARGQIMSGIIIFFYVGLTSGESRKKEH